MDYTLVIGLIVVVVVGFFAYQWMSKRPARMAKKTEHGFAPPAVPGQNEEKFPTIAGQTQAEALTKEPIQRRELSSQQAPVLANGEAPAQFEQHLRHPEQLFHQPSQGQGQADVASGRASETSTSLGPLPSGSVGPIGQQGFSPEMAQNGGAFLGNSVFAYDGMEPTGFTSF
jgi:hypothetical protein